MNKKLMLASCLIICSSLLQGALPVGNGPAMHVSFGTPPLARKDLKVMWPKDEYYLGTNVWVQDLRKCGESEGSMILGDELTKIHWHANGVKIMDDLGLAMNFIMQINRIQGVNKQEIGARYKRAMLLLSTKLSTHNYFVNLVIQGGFTPSQLVFVKSHIDLVVSQLINELHV